MRDQMPLLKCSTVGAIQALIFALTLTAYGIEKAGQSVPPLENLALKARVSANSEHNGSYAARFAVDGRIPVAGSQEDLNAAWCVKGETHRNQAVFTLEWTDAVPIAEVVYYGRTAWFAEECWKDCELYLDDASIPAAKTQFKMGHGPQRITLSAPARAKKLTLKFAGSYGGLNPGASEIQVFSDYAAASRLAAFRPLPAGRPEMTFEEEIPSSLQLAEQLGRGELGFSKMVLVQRRELNPSHVYTYHVEGFGSGGGLYIHTVAGKEKGAIKQLISAPEGQILDCDVSFDGKEILFSWRKQQKEGYQVFAINADGTNLRQLTQGPHHNYNAAWLPDGGIAFLSTRSSRFAYCWISPVGILYRMERDGSRVARLSANIVNDFTPSVHEDGRIIYSRWEYVDKPAIPIQSLWTIHPDGTELTGLYGNRILSPATFMEARSIPGREELLCVLTSHNGPARGALGLINARRGVNTQEAIQNLTPWIKIGAVGQGDGNNIRGPFENPYPIDARHFLVSRRGTVLVRDYEGKEQTVVMREQNGLGWYNPQPLRARVRPPILSAAVEPPADMDEWLEADTENTEKVQWATMIIQDVYQGLEPQVKRGEIAQICVVEEMRKAVRTDVANRAFGFQFPVISCGATYACKRVWGYVKVDEDGSAVFNVPAQRPIYFMALDKHGQALQRMRSFTHLMPGEVQGCVGCHEHRGKATEAIRLVVHRKPELLQPPEWGERVGFDYARMVQPVLNRHCTQCHSGPTPSAKVDLADDTTDFFNVSYEILARGRKRSGEAEWDSPYVSWIPTYNGMEQNILEVTPKAWGSPRSKLAELVLNGHPDAEGKPRIKLAENEKRRIFAWIDLNVPYYGTSETAYPEMKGCRQIYPPDLDKKLAEVAQRRCSNCHKKDQIPRVFWTRIKNPQLNNFLAAPLPKEAGGSGACGQPIFASKTDPDYQAIVAAFDSCLKMLAERPRMDMPGAKPALVDRSCLGKLD